MNRSIVSMLVSLAMAACGATATAPTSAVTTSSARGIDGTSYDVTLEFPGEAPVKDTLSFASGRFESTACTGFGFPRWTEYQARVDGGVIAFQVVTHHPQGGTVDWHGAVSGDGVEGTANRTLEGRTSAGTFRGSAHR
jgi:hypothetical protein